MPITLNAVERLHERTSTCRTETESKMTSVAAPPLAPDSKEMSGVSVSKPGRSVTPSNVLFWMRKGR
jgi:hypothetical protein